MTIISTLKKNPKLSNNYITRALMMIGKFLRKNRTHLAILVSTVIYLTVIPGIYTRYFVKLGKPADSIINLPYTSPFIRFSIDTTNMVPTTNQRVYQINGWAFLENQPDQTIYDKYLVLNSKDQIYYFLYEPVERQSVEDHFRDLGLDILNSGYRAYISADAIRTGKYNIGFLFINRSGVETYYTYTNRYILRTPNTDSIEIGEFPDASMVSMPVPSNVSSHYGAGKDLGLVKFGTDKQIQAVVDNFSKLTINGKQYGRLSGWAFLQGETDQSKYTRWILLQSDQDTIYFPVTFVERKDVQDVFPELKSRFSGFNVDILEEALPPGVYEISVVFQSRSQDANYHAKTPWFLTRTSSEFSLVKK